MINNEFVQKIAEEAAWKLEYKVHKEKQKEAIVVILSEHDVLVVLLMGY